ncbi:alcohol dehydrogenase [Penicillium samsonianum]|uniref:alcohol dehydrogenase n=1 Tax=Penicillium samsonianum TaxID=1882272 RepID=UPI002549650B|nr:alcohol dehydrogenase [Penicillium samsonianum]KAJ6150647.1 alcohol dehydrogenase [Penicillium samsonianum]
MVLSTSHKCAAPKEAGGPLMIEETLFALLDAVVPGHQNIGEVVAVAVGDSVSQWKVGDRLGGA